MIRRQTAESIERQKQQMIAAMYTNPNWDSEKADRAGTIKELEAHFNHAIELVYDPDADRKHEQEIDWDNPFWAAAKRAHERNLELLRQVRGDEDDKTMGELVEFDSEQAKARQRSRETIDQM